MSFDYKRAQLSFHEHFGISFNEIFGWLDDMGSRCIFAADTAHPIRKFYVVPEADQSTDGTSYFLLVVWEHSESRAFSFLKESSLIVLIDDESQRFDAVHVKTDVVRKVGRRSNRKTYRKEEARYQVPRELLLRLAEGHSFRVRVLGRNQQKADFSFDGIWGFCSRCLLSELEVGDGAYVDYSVTLNSIDESHVDCSVHAECSV